MNHHDKTILMIYKNMGGMWWGHIEVYPYNHQTNLIKAIELKNTNFNKITNLFLIHRPIN